ncbi:hypothetical protein N783_10420 [Pontibacillus marinus BH030004 = DSM 16465]|uniref:Uncharacterized protein n=1 Tax=Pontibacillus marinus BH030004 = DSM 16465 TaxID=1385511 RepID=A0A0A5HU22_9BACI|nr:hypothetical protein [Pontibacillus marinus]KGX87142.1 hypothetical protein N783_10420 [Pontibacillus marinus BH030004 = DSM 16465]
MECDFIYKKIALHAALIVGALILLYLMVDSYDDLKEANNRNDNIRFLLTKMTLWGCLFGVLLESKRVIALILGNIRLNWLLAPVIILLVLVFIPRTYVLHWFGVNEPFYIWMFLVPDTHMALSILSGVLLVRSLSPNE